MDIRIKREFVGNDGFAHYRFAVNVTDSRVRIAIAAGLKIRSLWGFILPHQATAVPPDVMGLFTLNQTTDAADDLLNGGLLVNSLGLHRPVNVIRFDKDAELRNWAENITAIDVISGRATGTATPITFGFILQGEAL